MSRFINDTLSDIRGGRESWRVFVAFCTPAFVLTLLALTLQHLV
jgi:hypothetical protein